MSPSCTRIADSSQATASSRVVGPKTRGPEKNGRNCFASAFAFSRVRFTRTRRSQFSSAHCQAMARPVPPPAPMIMTFRSRRSIENSVRIACRNPSPSVFEPINFSLRTRTVFTAPARVADSPASSTCANVAILCGTVRLIPMKLSLRKNGSADRSSLART